jgi:hypothetical protein
MLMQVCAVKKGLFVIANGVEYCPGQGYTIVWWGEKPGKFAVVMIQELFL